VDEADGMAVSLPTVLSMRSAAGEAAGPASTSALAGEGGAAPAAAGAAAALASTSAAVPAQAAASIVPAPSRCANGAAGDAGAPAPDGSAAGASASSSSSRGWGPADLVASKLGEAAAVASAVTLQPLASAAGSLYSSGLGLVTGAFSPSMPAADKLAAAAVAATMATEVAVAPHQNAAVKAASTSSAACPSEW
jgi:hypothetical protein